MLGTNAPTHTTELLLGDKMKLQNLNPAAFFVGCLCLYPLGTSATEATTAESDLRMNNFNAINTAPWKTVFSDPGTSDWKTLWTLDGQKATVTRVGGLNAFKGAISSTRAVWPSDLRSSRS